MDDPTASRLSRIETMWTLVEDAHPDETTLAESDQTFVLADNF